MSEIKRLSLMDELESSNLSEAKKSEIQYKLFKIDNDTDWMMIVFVAMSLIALLIAIIILQKSK